MKVLYISHKPIFPTVDGGCRAMQQFWKCLDHLNYTVTHLCISTEKHPFHIDNYPAEIRKRSEIHSVSIKTNPSVSGALGNLVSSRSYILTRFENDKIKENILEILKEKRFDAIIFESIFSAVFIDDIKKNSAAKLIIRTHNTEFKIWKDLSKNASYLKRRYLKKLAKDLKKEERELLNKADLIFSISERDTYNFNKLSVHTKIVTIPVAIEESDQSYLPTSSNISFLGAMNWQPNIEAVEILFEAILPRLRSKNPKLELNLAGSFMDDRFKSDPSVGIFNHGFVKVPEAFLAHNGIFVAPIESGSGVKIKVLEALATGTPVVTTTKGAEGIKSTDAILIEDNIEKMCSKIEKLLSSESQQATLSKQAKEFVHQNYSINSISKLILTELEF